MNKYFLNFLRWLTNGEIPDKVLKKSYKHKMYGGNFSFRIKANFNPKDWRYGLGSSK